MKENTFAQACYEQNSLEELRQALQEEPDSVDMATWGLNPQEWRNSILEALREKEDNTVYRLINHSEFLGAPCPEIFSKLADAEDRRNELVAVLSEDLRINEDDNAFDGLIIEEVPDAS